MVIPDAAKSISPLSKAGTSASKGTFLNSIVLPVRFAISLATSMSKPCNSSDPSCLNSNGTNVALVPIFKTLPFCTWSPP